MFKWLKGGVKVGWEVGGRESLVKTRRWISMGLYTCRQGPGGAPRLQLAHLGDDVCPVRTHVAIRFPLPAALKGRITPQSRHKLSENPDLRAGGSPWGRDRVPDQLRLVLRCG